jgi:HlyD family secretion protein
MKRNQTFRWLLGAGALLLAGLLAWAFRPQRLTVDAAPAARGPLVVTVDEEGRTRIKERYVVSAPLGGRMLRVGLKPGDAVAAGRTVIAALEPTDPELLDPRTRAQAEARVKAAEAARERTGPLLERAVTDDAYATAELARARDLFAHNGISRQEFDLTEQRQATARAELKSAEFQARIADFELELARAALLGGTGPAEPGPGRFELRAPITGRVLRVFQESEAVVAPGTRLVELGDPSDLEILVEVLSADAVQVKPGARVVIEHWGGEEPLAARVRVVEPAGFTKVSALGVEEQRVNVVADFAGAPDARRTVGDAFRVEARIVVWEAPDVLKVPVGALFHAGDQWAVFVVRGGRAALQAVQAGHRNDREVEILSGLAPGDTVIIHPSDKLEDGTRIRIR